MSFCIPTVAIANAIKINLECGDGTNSGKRWFRGVRLQLKSLGAGKKFIRGGGGQRRKKTRDDVSSEGDAASPVSCVIAETAGCSVIGITWSVIGIVRLVEAVVAVAQQLEAKS